MLGAVHKVLRRQGLFEGIWCLNPRETMGPDKTEELDRIACDYPQINNDELVLAQ